MKIALLFPTGGHSNVPTSFPNRANAVQRVEKYLRRQGHQIARFEMREGEFSPSFEFSEFAKVHDIEFAFGFGGEIAAHQLNSHQGNWAIFLSPEDVAHLSKFSPHLLSAMQGASAIIVDDFRVRDELFKRFPFVTNRIHYIRKAISCLPQEMGASPSLLGLPTEAHWFVLICRESTKEWIERIVERFDLWHRENPRIYLLTIGQDTGDLSSKEIAKHFNQPGIVAQSNLSPAIYAYTIQNAIAVINASDCPIESLYTLYAMQLEAIIAIRSKSSDEYLDARNCVQFTSPDDLDATCRALACTLHRTQLKISLGKAAKKTADEHFAHQREGEEYHSLLTKVMEKPRCTKPWIESPKAI